MKEALSSTVPPFSFTDQPANITNPIGLVDLISCLASHSHRQWSLN